MDCSNVKAQLFNFEENLLPADVRRTVEDHLQTCSECSAELKNIRRRLEKRSFFNKISSLILLSVKIIPVRFAGIAATLAIVVTVYITVYSPLKLTKGKTDAYKTISFEPIIPGQNESDVENDTEDEQYELEPEIEEKKVVHSDKSQNQKSMESVKPAAAEEKDSPEQPSDFKAKGPEVLSRTTPPALPEMKDEVPMGKISALGNRQLKEQMRESESKKMFSGVADGEVSSRAEANEVQKSEAIHSGPAAKDEESLSMITEKKTEPLQAGGRKAASAPFREQSDPSLGLSSGKDVSSQKTDPEKLINLVLVKKAQDSSSVTQPEDLPAKLNQYLKSAGGKLVSETRSVSSTVFVTELPYEKVHGLLDLLGQSKQYLITRRPVLENKSGMARIRIQFTAE